MWKVRSESFQTNVTYKGKFYYSLFNSVLPSLCTLTTTFVKPLETSETFFFFEIPFKIFIQLLIGSAFETNIFHDYVASITGGGRSWPEPISNFRGKDEMTIIEV